MGDLNHLRSPPCLPPPVPLTRIPPPPYSIHNLPPPVPLTKPPQSQDKVGVEQQQQIETEKNWALQQIKSDKVFKDQWQRLIKQFALQSLYQKRDREVVHETVKTAKSVSDRVDSIESRVGAVEESLTGQWLNVLEGNNESQLEMIENRFVRIENHFDQIDPGMYRLGMDNFVLRQELNQVKSTLAEERQVHAAQLALINSQLNTLQVVVDELASKQINRI